MPLSTNNLGSDIDAGFDCERSLSILFHFSSTERLAVLEISSLAIHSIGRTI